MGERYRQQVLAQRQRHAGRRASRQLVEGGEVIFTPPNAPTVDSACELATLVDTLRCTNPQTRAYRRQVEVAIRLQHLHRNLEKSNSGRNQAGTRPLARNVASLYLQWLKLRAAGAKKINSNLGPKVNPWCNDTPDFMVFITYCLRRAGVPFARFAKALLHYQHHGHLPGAFDN